MTARLASLGCILAACAAPRPTMSAEQAFGSSTKRLATATPSSPQEFKRWAASFQRPVECHQGARDLEAQRGHESGWAAIEACIARGDFSLLREFLSWSADWRVRPEGPALLAQVVAAYGGSNLTEALTAARARGLDLQDAATLAATPRASVGKTSLLMGYLIDAGTKRNHELVLVEVGLGSSGGAPAAPPGFPTNNTIAPNINSDGTRRFGPQWKDNGRGYMERTVTPDEMKQFEREHTANEAARELRGKPPQKPAWNGNELTETGFELAARVAPGVEFVKGRPYVLLARVEGTRREPRREGEEQEPPPTVLAQVLGAWEVDVHRSEFLGR